MADTPKPDAIMVPRAYKNKGGPRESIPGLIEEFKPILGDHPWFTTHGEYRIVHATRNIHVNFPIGHERAGETRFRWEDRGDGVLFGYFVDEEAKNAAG